MKRKGLVLRLAVLAVVLCLVTMSLTAGTLAKYASEVAGNATATVAKWNVSFKDGTNTDYTSSSEIALKPDKAKFVDKNLVVDNVVAPGITGALELKVDGSDTEVAFDYTIELDLANIKKGDTVTTDCPLQFFSDANCTTALDTTGNKVSVKGTVYTNAASKEASQTIYWKWVSATDAADTALGEASATAPVIFKIPATIRAEQTLTPASGT